MSVTRAITDAIIPTPSRTVFNTLIPYFAYDQVGVFDQNFNQVFPKARTIKAVIKEESKLMEHPIETGGIITDHRIILPVEIELSVMVQDKDGLQDVYKQVRQYFLNATLLTVQTKSGVYKNQVIASMPHEENPDQFDVLVIAVSLKQIQFATAAYALNPRNPKNSSTVSRGAQQPQEVTDSSLASKIFDSGKSLWGGLVK